jgi:hypothetical protein
MDFEKLAIQAAFEALSPSFRLQFGEEIIKSALTEDLQTEQARSTDETFGEEFRLKCPVLGATARDYCPREHMLLDGRRVLASIRFRTLDLKQPFVQIFATTKAWQSGSDLKAAASELSSQFDVFQPRWFQVMVSPTLATQEMFTVDRYVVAGKVGHVFTSTSQRAAHRVDLFPVTEINYRRYAKLYSELESELPEIAHEVRVESEESLEECRKEGLLFDIIVNGEWAGTMAARSEPLLGIPGVIIVEEILATSWRRKGLGPVLQHCLAEKIIQKNGENKLLHGTIAGINLPSLRTALRCGREIVTTFVRC